MKRLLTTIRDQLKNRRIRYLVLFGVLAGALWFMRDAPCDVTISVDLERVHRLGDGVLDLVEVKVLDTEGSWISTSTFEFPRTLYPDGPGPVRTRAEAIQLQLAPGTYQVNLTMRYERSGPGKTPPELRKDFEITVDERETRRVLRP
ncbi:MAG: hypothetical protein ABIK09_08805 [Pseudomonadota bacterium]